MPNVSVSPGMVLVGVRELLPAQANASGVLPTGVFPVQPFIAELLKATLPVTSGFILRTIIDNVTYNDPPVSPDTFSPFVATSTLIAGNYQTLALNLSVGSLLPPPSSTISGSIILSLYAVQPQSGIVTDTLASTGWVTSTEPIGLRLAVEHVGYMVATELQVLGSTYHTYLDAEFYF